MSGPITVLTWAVDLPDGLIRAMIGAVGGMRMHGVEEVGANWVGPSWE